MLLKTSRNLSTICMVIAFIFISSSCKKTDALSTPSPSYSSTGELLAVDGVSSAAKKEAEERIRDVYYWYKHIPTSFNALSYSSLKDITNAVRQYSIEPGFSNPVDRWSFAITPQQWASLSSGHATGDVGLYAAFLTETDLRVKSVEKGSPAASAGVKRGWRITKINGSSNISVNNIAFINDALSSSSTSFTFSKPDNTEVTLRLNAASYNSNAVDLDNVYELGNGKNVGYIVLNSFMGDKADIYRDFQNIFRRFNAKGVTDLIVDLRYNGGGYVEVQERLSNYLIQSANDGKVMQKVVHNDKNNHRNTTTTFTKLGSLNINKVYFIVSRSTASASESLINSLRPYMSVIIIGPSPTTGKAVGFFNISVDNWVLFPVSFKIFNAKNEGNYFNGFRPNIQAADGVTYDWGDPKEPCLAAALENIAGRRLARGAEVTAEARSFIQNASVINANDKLDSKSFKGMVKEQ